MDTDLTNFEDIIESNNYFLIKFLIMFFQSAKAPE